MQILAEPFRHGTVHVIFPCGAGEVAADPVFHAAHEHAAFKLSPGAGIGYTGGKQMLRGLTINDAFEEAVDSQTGGIDGVGGLVADGLDQPAVQRAPRRRAVIAGVALLLQSENSGAVVRSCRVSGRKGLPCGCGFLFNGCRSELARAPFAPSGDGIVTGHVQSDRQPHPRVFVDAFQLVTVIFQQAVEGGGRVVLQKLEGICVGHQGLICGGAVGEMVRGDPPAGNRRAQGRHPPPFECADIADALQTGQAVLTDGR